MNIHESKLCDYFRGCRGQNTIVNQLLSALIVQLMYVNHGCLSVSRNVRHPADTVEELTRSTTWTLVDL